MDKDRLKQLADDLREALVDAHEASQGLQRSIANARVALAEIDGLMGGGEQRDRNPGPRQRKAIQVIHDAGGAFGSAGWATKDSIRDVAGNAALAKAARDLSARYVEREGDLRRVTELGEYWRTLSDNN